MDLGFNENSITKENFADIASEKISRILCLPGNGSFRAWAVKFLQKATRGFALGEHEPWLNSLYTVESTSVILSNCKYSIREIDLAMPSVASSLSFIIHHPLQFNLFIATLASNFISKIEDSQRKFCGTREILVEQSNELHAQKTDSQISYSMTGCNNYQNACESGTHKKYIRSVSDSGSSKMRKINCGTQSLKTDEIIRFLKHVWDWARTGHVKLEACLLGDVLCHLPECIEEVVLSWAKEALRSNKIGNDRDREGTNQSFTTAGSRRDTIPNDDDMLHSLSVLQESPVFMAVAATSPKLFQRSSSILNQLLIQSSECSCSWSLLLSLCRTFAQETGKGRAGFYPLQIQPLILLMEIDPNTLSSDEQRDFISCQVTSMCTSLPTEITVAVLSHFPAWLPFLDHAILL